jgi:hypothetical protein
MRVLDFAPPFGDDSNYFKRLRREWFLRRGFINIEHDIVERETSFDELWACPHDWCAAPYPYLDRPRQFGLGCVKFSAALIARHPQMFDVIGTWCNDKHPPKHWCTLDSWIYQYLTGRGEKRCEDHELVAHFGHPGKKSSAHGCFQVP